MVISIQYLRAIAASMVILFHAGTSANPHMHLQDLFSPGAAGVDIFFVISGFIMWQSTARRSITAPEFLRKRLTRIVPLYWFVTLVMCAMPFVSGTIAAGVLPDVKHSLASFAFIPWHSAGDASGTFFPVCRAGWTLNFEMFFYLVFACCLLIGDTRLRLLAAVATFSTLALIGFWAPPNSVAAWSLSLIILEFAAGLCIGAWAGTRRRIPLYAAVLFLIVGFAAVAATTGIEMTLDGRVLYWGIPAMFIIVGAVELERLGLLPEWPALLLVGDASYSLYLTHICAVGSIEILWNHFHLWESVSGVSAFFVVAFVASHITALVVHKNIELPLIEHVRKLWSTGKPASIAGARQ